MPTIQSLDCGADGPTVNGTDAPIAAVDTAHEDPQACEDRLRAQLQAQVGDGGRVDVHVFTVDPLVYTALVANRDVTVPARWWQPDEDDQ